MKGKIRNFRVSTELDLKLVESAHRLGADPSTYLISPDPQPRVAGFAPPAAQHGAT